MKKSRRRTSTVESTREPARFLTIDLDVRSRRSLAPLLSAWPEAYHPANNSRWLIRTASGATNAEAAAENLLRHVAKLKGAALHSWQHAHRRVFDIGVRAGAQGRVFEDVHLSAETLRRIASAGVQIQVTVYPAVPK